MSDYACKIIHGILPRTGETDDEHESRTRMTSASCGRIRLMPLSRDAATIPAAIGLPRSAWRTFSVDLSKGLNP